MSTATTGATIAAAGDFRVGNVLRRAASVLARHIVLFSLVAFIVQLPNLLLLARFGFRFAQPQPHLTVAEALHVAGVVWAGVIILVPLTQTIIYHAAFQDMLGRPIRFADSLALALRRFFPVLGALVCMVVPISLGFMLLIVPGVILTTIFVVTVPACVMEQLGPFASLRRSATLTKGNRWRVFGIGALILVIGIVAGVAVGVQRFVLGPWAGGIVGFVVNAVMAAFYSIIIVVTYHDLRVAKEGVDTQRIAAVFD